MNNLPKTAGKPIAIVTSDWHIALNAWKKLPDIKGDAEYSLRQIVDIAIGLNLPIIAAGDLFDVKHPDSYTVNVTASHMARLHAAGLKCYYVQGQHEMANPTWFSLFPGCEHVHDRRFDIGGVSFFGYDYFLPTSVEDSYNRFKPADALVTHQVWSELLPHAGQEFCCSYTLVGQNTPYKALISGDFHSHLVTPVGDMKFVSPGSICLQDLKESCNKALWVMTDKFEFLSVPYYSRKLVHFTIDSEKNLHSLVASADELVKANYQPLPDDIGKPIFRIRYSSSVDNVNAAVMAAFKGKAHIDLVQVLDEENLVPLAASGDNKELDLDADASFHESLKDFCDTGDRSYSDLVGMWSARSVDDLRSHIGFIASDIREKGSADKA